MTPSESQRARVRVILLSIFASFVILILKVAAYEMTGSAALKSDALESLVNIVAAIFALGAVVFAGRPADKGHPYGHGKMEYFSSAFEGGLISLASVLILMEGARSLYMGVTPHKLEVGLFLNLGAGALNGVLGFILIRSGRKYKSKALEADGHHVMTDFYTTVGIGAGLFVVQMTGWNWLDPLMAIGVGLLLARTGFKLVRESSAALLDEEDPKVISKLVQLMNRIRPKDVVAIHELRTMRSGRFTHVDVHVVVPEFYEIKRAHDLVEEFGQQIISKGELEGEFHSHVDACERHYCRECSVEPCPIRAKPFESRPLLTEENATALGPLERGLHSL